VAEYGLRAAVLSVEPWDDVWRRNQYLAAEVVRSGVVTSLLWVSPPSGGFAPRARTSSPMPGVTVVEPPLLVPRRWGGHRVLGRWLRRSLGDIDVLWVNDPVAGVAALRPDVPAVYDITDDWRSMPQPDASRRRIVTAEDELAQRATTVVCSQVLADRWRARYDVAAVLVRNGVDAAVVRSAARRSLDGAAPHAVYVGTVHRNRIDLDVVIRTAAQVGTIHLVGPHYLDADDRSRLDVAGVRLHGMVPAAEVPSWLVSADVLVCPHLVDDFTLSLDAIKAHEYLATDRPVVATPSCGFQTVTADGLTVLGRDAFPDAVREAIGTGPFERPAPVSWSERGAEFAAVLLRAVGAR
jgi:teichuronic acid biosynthesis glycosyltransferase TuaH